MRIDVHNHVMPERSLELLRSEPAYGVTLDGRRWSGGLHVDFEIVPSFVEPAAKLAELESKGIDAAVVSVTPPLFYYHVDVGLGERMARATNEGLAEFCAAAPDRFRWLASVPMQDPGRAVEVLSEAVEAGAVGVEIGTAVAGGRRLDEAEFEPFWAAAERLGVPVTLHPAYGERNPSLDSYYFENVLGFLFETTVTIERLIVSGTLDRHPDLTVVLLHGGGYFPYQVGRLRHARTVRPELASAPARSLGVLAAALLRHHHPRSELARVPDRPGRARARRPRDGPAVRHGDARPDRPARGRGRLRGRRPGDRGAQSREPLRLRRALIRA